MNGAIRHAQAQQTHTAYNSITRTHARNLEGIPGTFGKWEIKAVYSVSLVSASGNNASAPAATYAFARSIAPSMPAPRKLASYYVRVY